MLPPFLWFPPHPFWVFCFFTYSMQAAVLAIQVLVCVGLLLLLYIFYLCLNCLVFPCVLCSAPGYIPYWGTGNAFAQPVSDQMLASSGALLRQQHCRGGPGYLPLATLDWYLEICFSCQEIYYCNHTNISSKQTKSYWVCFCCCLFMDGRCQVWSLTVRNSMAILKLFGSAVTAFISSRWSLLDFSVSGGQQVTGWLWWPLCTVFLRCHLCTLGPRLPPQWLWCSWMPAAFPNKDDTGILVVCFVLKCPFVVFKHLFPLLR